MPHEIVDHTADLALELRGKTLSELFESAVSGFCELLIDPTSVADSERFVFGLSKPTLESLLVGFFNELILNFDTIGFIPKTARVKIYQRHHTEGDISHRDESGDVSVKLESKDSGFECESMNSGCFSQLYGLSWQLECEVLGETINPDKHKFLHCIKAATYGGLRFEKNDEGWRVVVILDD
ncbi:MAG TPA: archease [Caldisericia bacterium]|nr:archease [Caldisericia bacterium]HPF48672.1 archease [Caldisericia bacterium]HPI83668.1 archease [Caldisericia bacterium]HPQ93127.1 archease [Caldisericia bacterium]HRV75040.1 archease [Caldisericia bacterium]